MWGQGAASCAGAGYGLRQGVVNAVDDLARIDALRKLGAKVAFTAGAFHQIANFKVKSVLRRAFLQAVFHAGTLQLFNSFPIIFTTAAWSLQG